ncbi:MAG: glycosyltransferase family 39 protein [Candidatus Goldbacteria bacterium]|nr:glycosyltransferase family 39 protein [Candidatus Goldiibacteriota bacterium]
MYIGEHINQGKIPYKDIWDHKPPLIYFLNALLFKFFPAESKTIAVFECFWIIFISIIVFLFSKKFFNNKTAFLITLTFTLILSNLSFTKSFGKTETYMLFPIILSVYSFFNFQQTKNIIFIILSGLFFSIALLFKQTAISILFPILFFLLIDKINFIEKLKILFCFFMGIFIPILILLFYLIKNDVLKDFISQVLIYNSFYIKILNYYNIKNLLNSYLFKRPSLLLFLICGLIIIIYEHFFKKTKEKNIIIFIHFLIIWLISDIFFVSLSKRFYPNYFIQLLPVLVFIAGIFLNFIIKNTKIYISIIILIFFIFILSGATSHMEYAIRFDLKPQNYLIINNNKYTGPDISIIKWILENTKENDYIYFWGSDTRLNFVTKRKSPTKYTYIYPLLNYKYITSDDFERFYNDLIKNKPKYICDSIGFFEENINSETAKKFINRLNEFGFDCAIPIYFDKILEFIRKNYDFYCYNNIWKIFKLKNQQSNF